MRMCTWYVYLCVYAYASGSSSAMHFNIFCMSYACHTKLHVPGGCFQGQLMRRNPGQTLASRKFQSLLFLPRIRCEHLSETHTSRFGFFGFASNHHNHPSLGLHKKAVKEMWFSPKHFHGAELVMSHLIFDEILQRVRCRFVGCNHSECTDFLYNHGSSATMQDLCQVIVWLSEGGQPAKKIANTL